MRKSGGAKDWYEDFGNSGAKSEWQPQRIANSSTDYPMAGDIVVLGGQYGFGYGHVYVADFNDNPNVINGIEQNGGAGTGKGVGTDAIRRVPRYEAPLGWIRIPAIYNRIHGEDNQDKPQNTFDINSIINTFANTWNNRLKPFWADDGNTFGTLRGRWYLQQYQEALNPLAEEIENQNKEVERLNNIVKEKSAINESLSSEKDNLKTEKDKLELENKNLTQKLIETTSLKDKFSFDKLIVGIVSGKNPLANTTLIAFLSSLSLYLTDLKEVASGEFVGGLSMLTLGVSLLIQFLRNTNKIDKKTE
jgi:hypothetical protein